MVQPVQLLDQYIDGTQLFLQAHAVLAPLLLILIEETGIPTIIPGDAVIAYVGYNISKHPTATWWQALLVTLVAVFIGSSLLFFIARRWGQYVIEKLGKFVFIKQTHIDKAERLFQRYGVWAIIFGRHIPGMRVPTTIFAATSGVKYAVFLGSTFVSTVLWVLIYLKLGQSFGGNLSSVFRHDAHITLLVFLAICLLIVGLHVIGRRKRAVGGAKPPEHID